MRNNKVGLAVIFYGDADQKNANEKQFFDLKEILPSFTLTKYDFNSDDQDELVSDFRKGKIDMVLKNSYGRTHESTIESFLESHKIPYLGSDSKTTFVGTSKYLSKQFFRLNNLPVADDIFIDEAIWRFSKNKLLDAVEKQISYPCILKDVGGTDSRGIFLVDTQEKLTDLLNRNLRKFESVLVEKYIHNCQEITCLAVGNENPQAYEPVEFENISGGLITDKEKDGHSIILKIPAKLTASMRDRIQKITKEAHQALGCRTFSRSDILIKNGKCYLLEVDVHPGFRKTSPTIKSAEFQNESADELFLKFFKLTQGKIYGKI